MATPRLKIDLFDPEIQQIRDRFELEAYPDGGGLATDMEITRRYQVGFRRPYVSALIADVLTGRWNLGATMTQVADTLGTDHPTISHALRWGDLPMWLESYLLACRNRPHDWEEPIKRVFFARHRSALISVVEYLWQKRQETRGPMTARLGEAQFELMAVLFEKRRTWKKARENKDMAIVRQMVSTVFYDKEREIAPFWYDKRRVAQVARLMDRLRKDVHFALRYLCLLETWWEGALVATHAATEEMGWLNDEWSPSC